MTCATNLPLMAKRSRPDSAQSEAGPSQHPRARTSGFRLAATQTQRQTHSRIITLKPNRRHARRTDRRQNTPPNETPPNETLPNETPIENKHSNDHDILNSDFGDDELEYAPFEVSEDAPPVITSTKPKRKRDFTTSVMSTALTNLGFLNKLPYRLNWSSG